MERPSPMTTLHVCRCLSAPWLARCRLPVAVVAALLVLLTCAGCEALAFTDEQLIRQRLRLHAAAVTTAIETHDWSAPAAYYDSAMRWQQGRAVVQGPVAIKGFLNSLSSIKGVDSFHTIVDSTRKVNAECIEATVTFQAHLVISSAELNFSNCYWQARVGWVKRGPGKWLIGYIVETSERKSGTFSRI